jgi:uncharacterized protein (TIGR03437 family)
MRPLILAVLFVLLLLLPLPGAVAPWPTDGWAQSSPEEQGINSALLQAGDAYVRSQCPTRYSFLVVRNGYLVWEQYYHGMSRDRYADVMSISKSILSLLIGQALDNGRIESLDRKMADYFPEYFSASTDTRKRQITLRQMLTMTAGFQWDEVATGNDWVASKDWYKFVIDLPIAANPGDVFDYNTGLSHLLAGVLSRASGQSALAVGAQNLFEPLGISNFRWDTDPRGNYVGGFHMYFTSGDLAKFGYLALRQGFWEDRQLVSRSWIEDSTSFHISYASDVTIGDYGYHWWVRPQWGYNAYMAAGYGGQYIFVVPGLDLIMVSTADTTGDTIDRHMQAFNLLTQYVIPAIKSVTDPYVTGEPRVDAVVNAASFSGGPAAGGWSAITGSNLSNTTRAWNEEDIVGGNLPVQLDGVSVTIGGKPAYLGYVSPQQLNVLVPGGVTTGDVTVTVTSAPGHSGAASSTLSDIDPALFLWNGRFAVAQHADYTAVGMPGLFPDLATTPAKPGETILLYGTGFGPTAPASGIGEIARQAAPLPSLPAVSIGDAPAVVEYAGIPQGGVGLYQINVRVPESTADGDLPVSLVYGEAAAPVAYLTVRR